MSNRRKMKPTGIKWPAPRDRRIKITWSPVTSVAPTLAELTDELNGAVDVSRNFREVQFTGGGR